MEQILSLSFFESTTARYVGTIVSLLNPADAMWRRAAYQAVVARGFAGARRIGGRPAAHAARAMRIYDGSPRQDWEEVLRSVGAFADAERVKELLLLELDGGFLLQGLGVAGGGADSDTYGSLAKKTYELTDDQVAELMDANASRRGTAERDRPLPEMANYYELAMRIIGAYIDTQKAHDVFLFEQDGSFVLRLFGTTGTRGTGHQLSEFTRDEILAMIESAPEQRQEPAPNPSGAK